MTDEQRQVTAGMAAAGLVTLGAGAACALTGWRPWDFGTGLPDRLLYGFACILPVLACLAVAIGAAAAFRFGSPADIGGAALTEGTPGMRLRAGFLANTHEQVSVAVPVYLAAAMMLPERWLGTVAAASILFVAGRVGFARGYRGGAAKRAFGFAVGFYPTVLLLVACIAAFKSR